MKYFSIIKYILLIVSAVLVIAGALSSTENFTFDAMLVWAAVMIVLTIVLVLVMPLVGVFQNPKSAVGSMVGLGILLVVALISYALASDAPMTIGGGEVIDDSMTLKFSDMALYATYFAFAGVIASIIFGELYKVFKK